MLRIVQGRLRVAALAFACAAGFASRPQAQEPQEPAPAAEEGPAAETVQETKEPPAVDIQKMLEKSIEELETQTGAPSEKTVELPGPAAGMEAAGMEAAPDSPFEGRRIDEVDFKGIVKSDAVTVKSVVNTKPRDVYSQELVDKDIKSLFNLELFDNIQVDVQEGEGGLLVTFVFTELPTIRKIEIRGNNKLKDRAIKEKILLKEGSVYVEQGVLDDAQAIVKFYMDRGYPSTKVKYEAKGSKEKDKKSGVVADTVDVFFDVEESRKLVITSLNLSGVQSLKTDKVYQKMKTRPKGKKFSSGHFKEDQFELDKLEILKFYGENGYIDAQIPKIDKNVTRNEKKNRDEMALTLYIEEGKQYTYGGIVISGNEIFTDTELYPLVKLKNGETFNRTEFDKGVQSIRDLFANNGYIYFTMDLQEKKDAEKLIISYEIVVKENNKAHIENIYITGNKKTKKFVIERELEIMSGEMFSSKKIQRSVEKLYNLQFFSAVNVDIKPGTEVGLVDLILDVEEQRTGLFSFGLSYSTSGYGIAFFEEVTANNFLGRGLRLYEKVELGYIRQVVEVGIDEPWFLGRPILAGLTLSYARVRHGEEFDDAVYTFNDGTTLNGIEVPDGVTWEEVPPGSGNYVFDYSNVNSMDYVSQSYKIALRLGKRFPRYWGLRGELAFSMFQNSSDTNDVPYEGSLRENINGGWDGKNYLSITGYRDSRNLVYFATRGSYVAQTFSFYGGPLGGYSNFTKSITDFNINVKTFWKLVFSYRFQVGFIFPWLGLPERIDSEDYFKVDGLNEGRGWQRPSQFLVSPYSAASSGELEMSFEYRVPIVERIAWGLTFFDIAGISGSPGAMTIDLKDYFYSFGIGVSILIPAFPLRFYLARRFKYEDGQVVWANSQEFFRAWDFVFAVAGYF